MNHHKADAIAASAFNIHIGPIHRGDFMTPAKVNSLPAHEKIKLAAMLAENGGSDLYSKSDARDAVAFYEAQVSE